jgi:hypothetical protein
MRLCIILNNVIKMKVTLRDDKAILEFNIGSYDKNTINFLTNIELSQKSKATEKRYKFII